MQLGLGWDPQRGLQNCRVATPAQVFAPKWVPRCDASLLPPGRSGVQLQVGDVFLDPGVSGVGTDLPASLGLEAVEEGKGGNNEASTSISAQTSHRPSTCR